MDIERKCLQCWYCAEDTSPKQQPTLIGQRSYMCLANPPTSSAVLTQNGIILVAAYPQVNKESISCARHTPPPPAEVRQLVRKGTNNGNT